MSAYLTWKITKTWIDLFYLLLVIFTNCKHICDLHGSEIRVKAINTKIIGFGLQGTNKIDFKRKKKQPNRSSFDFRANS